MKRRRDRPRAVAFQAKKFKGEAPRGERLGTGLWTGSDSYETGNNAPPSVTSQENTSKSGTVEIEKLLDEFGVSLDFLTPHDVDDQIQFAFGRAVDALGRQRAQRIFPEIERTIRSRVPPTFYREKSDSVPKLSRDIEHPPETQNYEPQQMAPQEEDIVIRKDGSVVKAGVIYQPLAFAASKAQTHRTTLLHWIKDKTKIAGAPLRSHYLAPMDAYFVSEDSIQRAANRFVKWSHGKPAGSAGAVILRETDDRTGYIGLQDARAILGISNRTMYLWATQKGKAPTDEPLDIIKDPISNHLYIKEQDVYDLKKLVPKRGLQRGRRPQLALQP